MKHKSDVTSTWKSMISTIKSMGHSISRVKIDNDTVFLCTEYTAVCEFKGIAIKIAIPHAQWQLGMIER